MANHGSEQERRQILVCFDIISFRVEVRLGDPLEIVIVDCLRFAEDCTSQALIRWNTDHMIAVQD